MLPPQLDVTYESRRADFFHPAQQDAAEAAIAAGGAASAGGGGAGSQGGGAAAADASYHRPEQSFRVAYRQDTAGFGAASIALFAIA